MIPTLTRGEKSLELPALEPSDALLFSKHSVDVIYKLIQSGELPQTGEGARQWVSSDPQNKLMFEAAKKLLGEYSFADADKAFQDAYLNDLVKTPEGKASLLLAKANVQTGWVLRNLDPMLILALAK